MNRYKQFFKEGFSTPWGEAQNITKLATGITWVSTAGHGGLMIAKGVAKKILTASAIKASADSFGGYYTFEEDVAWAVPVFDSDYLLDLFIKKMNPRHETPDGLRKELEQTIKSYFPKYFQYIQQGLKHKDKLKVGDTIKFNTQVSWGTFKMNIGDTALVTKLTPSSIIINNRYKFPYAYYEKDDVVKSEAIQSQFNIKEYFKDMTSELEQYSSMFLRAYPGLKNELEEYYEEPIDDLTGLFEISSNKTFATKDNSFMITMPYAVTINSYEIIKYIERTLNKSEFPFKVEFDTERNDYSYGSADEVYYYFTVIK